MAGTTSTAVSVLSPVEFELTDTNTKPARVSTVSVMRLTVARLDAVTASAIVRSTGAVPTASADATATSGCENREEVQSLERSRQQTAEAGADELPTGHGAYVCRALDDHER